jgi:HSP20 family protein
MAVVQWRPLRDVFSLQEEINRMFDELVGRPPVERREERQTWTPAVDVYETKDAMVVEIEAPGIDKKDLHLSIQDNVLTVKGERRWQQEKKEHNYHRMERVYGSFQRSFTLPVTVDANRVKATYKDGILTVNLPKVEEARPKEIAVKVE